jgi:hypothetical protein
MATAEEGATGGAQLDVSSPSGTNRFHGRLFEYVRNDIFDAPEPLWASNGESQQPLRLNQFGGSVGGPSCMTRPSSSSLQKPTGRSGATRSAATCRARRSLHPFRALRRFTGSCTPTPERVQKPFLTPWTPANDPGDPNYADYDLLTCSCTQVVNENSAMLRLDQHFSARTTASCASTTTGRSNTQPLSAAATDLQQRVSTPVNGALELLHVFSPKLANEAKFGFNRATSNTYNYSKTGIRSIRLRFPRDLGRALSPRTTITTAFTWATPFRGSTT